MQKLKRDNNLKYESQDILVSAGAKQSISNALAALINEKDEVIIIAPYWASYPDMVSLFGGNPIIIPTKAENNFQVTPEQIKQAITNKTKAIIINSPNNPTEMYTKEETLEKFPEY